MKRLTLVVAVLLWVGASWAQGLFEVHRLVITSGIQAREPVDALEEVAADTERLYCFLEARDIKEDTTVVFLWLHEGKQMARVELPLKKGYRWRTYSSKRLGGLKGQWEVLLQDAQGRELAKALFRVR
jgi:hypothetical protein